MQIQGNPARENYQRLLRFLMIAATLVLFAQIGTVIGIALTALVAVWLVLGRHAPLQNRGVVIGLAALVLVLQVVFLMTYQRLS